jgi:hypothetical protein
MQYRNNNSRFEFGSSSNQQSGGNNAAWFDDKIIMIIRVLVESLVLSMKVILMGAEFQPR